MQTGRGAESIYSTTTYTHTHQQKLLGCLHSSQCSGDKVMILASIISSCSSKRNSKGLSRAWLDLLCCCRVSAGTVGSACFSLATIRITNTYTKEWGYQPPQCISREREVLGLHSLADSTYSALTEKIRKVLERDQSKISSGCGVCVPAQMGIILDTVLCVLKRIKLSEVVHHDPELESCD